MALLMERPLAFGFFRTLDLLDSKSRVKNVRTLISLHSVTLHSEY